MKDYLRYIHTSSDESTIKDFFQRNLAYTSNLSLYDFLKYEGDTQKSNITRIYEKYSLLDSVKYDHIYQIISHSSRELVESHSVEIESMPLQLNTELLIKTDDLNNQLVVVKGKNLFLEQKNQRCFWSKKITQLLSDPLYVPAETMSFTGIGRDVDFVNENVQVWIWSRAQDRIIDVSPFIQVCTTSKSEVGSFTLVLNPVKGFNQYQKLQTRDILNFFNIREYNGTVSYDFFHKNFQQNDVVFIRFERLKLEDKYGQKPYYTFDIPKTDLPGQVWDMIGLLDSNNVDISFGSVDYTVNLTGRDFVKLLTEDGSYILNLAYLVGSDKTSLVTGYNKEGKFFKRIYLDPSRSYNPLLYSFLSSVRSISDSIGFLVNQISNIGVLGGSDLFSQYKERRTKAYSITGEDQNITSSQLVDGVWQIIKFFVDDQLKNRRVMDQSLAHSDGVLIEQFNKLCQEPFVEFFGDTYGDEFNFIVRQPPFTKAAILSFLGKKLVSESTLKILENDTLVEVPEEKFVRGEADLVIDIKERDIEKLSLDWDETYYSWYQIEPVDGVLKDLASITAGGMIPIVFFEEIAEAFGNHRKIVQSNYIVSDWDDINTYKNALFNDLKYLIDINFYLPFTRKGTINLVKGDRRIKKGCFVRLEQTGEIYYVNSVSNSIVFSGDNGAANRSTTLQVSRGMIEEYISGYKGWDHDGNLIDGGNTQFSYFDIVRCDVTKEVLIQEPIDLPSQLSTISNPYVSHTKNSDLDKDGYLVISAQAERYRPLVAKYFPPHEVDNAMRIMQAESGGNPIVKPAVVPAHFNKAGNWIPESHSWGLFQINDYWNSGYFTNPTALYLPKVDIQDPEYNIQTAYKIWSAKGGGWHLWETSTKPGVLSNGKIQNSLESSSISRSTTDSSFDFKLDKKQWDFFLKRQQNNIIKI